MHGDSESAAHNCPAVRIRRQRPGQSGAGGSGHFRSTPRSRHQEGAGVRPRSQTANAISSKPASQNQIIAYRM